MDNEKKIILFPVASHFLFHFYEIAFPALAIPLTLSLGMELKDVLALGFPMYLLFGLGALPWGIFADHTSNRLALIIGFFGVAAGSFLTALSTTPRESWGPSPSSGPSPASVTRRRLVHLKRGQEPRDGPGSFHAWREPSGSSRSFPGGLSNWLAGWQVAYVVMGP
jgi:MFS family permease